MAKTVQSRKAKGRRLQQYIVKLILKYFPFLSNNDVRSTPMGVNGVDVQLSDKASNIFPFNIEAKNTEAISIWTALAQAEQSARDNGNIPLLVFKRNRSKVYCAMEFESFVSLFAMYSNYIMDEKERKEFEAYEQSNKRKECND